MARPTRLRLNVSLKTLPWISLVLVSLSYSTLGWVLSDNNAPLYLWILLILAILVLVASLTVSVSVISKYSSLLVSSNLRSFTVATLGAFLFFLMLAWFGIFLDMLLIICAGILARIDCQTAGITQLQAFLIILLFSLGGLGCGHLLHFVSSGYV
ncbi:hypothetical protein NWP22_09910 [Anabaenopsis tanganyikae CS-531]|uniref:NADH dehydrogenase subunit 6 n=2 Tax=Anabaenopsis TaxID=110103 RepID=A0ABT5AM67_9CYAN|nr:MULTISPECIES: hypothetical protein [Anabaenopsis]MDB9538395.1 hypothetical protein [Anabaenopsis arnoldii]MDH6090661.1 hypothetical protein [Anabaenopsis arnoldii]MDH6106178.1 hypothetical protein [Anabaenopsis tanganyikae CS-531]